MSRATDTSDEAKKKRKEANAKYRREMLERDPLYYWRAQQKNRESHAGGQAYREYQKRYYLDCTKQKRKAADNAKNAPDDYSDLVPLDAIDVFRSWAVICSAEYAMIGHEVEDLNCEW